MVRCSNIIHLGKIVCQECSGELVKKDWYALCSNCGAKWIMENYQDGTFKNMRRVDG